MIGSPESEWGSIGVIVTHFSYEKMLEEDGIKVTTIKSAELKAVGGPYKDLSEKEVDHIKAQVDQYNDLFQEHVRSNRPSVRLSSMKGETYIGQEALRMGLIDAVMSYDQTIEYIKSKRTKQTQTGGYRMKMTAEELKVALEAGATLESLGLTDEEAQQIAASVENAEEPAATIEEVTEPVVEVPELQAQLSALTEQLTAKEAELEATKEALAKVEADAKHSAEMRTIVENIMNDRRVALKLSKLDFSAFSTESLLTDFKAVTEQFNTAFKTGGLFTKKEVKQTPAVATDRVHASLLDAAA